MSLTRRNDKQIENKYNSDKWRKLDKIQKNHSIRDLQKFHQNEQLGNEQILDTRRNSNLLWRVCSYF